MFLVESVRSTSALGAPRKSEMFENPNISVQNHCSQDLRRRIWKGQKIKINSKASLRDCFEHSGMGSGSKVHGEHDDSLRALRNQKYYDMVYLSFCDWKIMIEMRAVSLWGTLWPEATVTLIAVWKWGISKWGILKSPITHVTNFIGWIKLIFWHCRFM